MRTGAGEEALGSGDQVVVTVPARGQYVGVVRLAAAAVAARGGFTYDEVEDLKIAVGEACTALLGPGDGAGTLVARFRLQRESLEVRLAAQAPRVDLGPAPPSREDIPRLDEGRLGLFLMRCLVDEVSSDHDEVSGTTELRLVKRRQG